MAAGRGHELQARPACEDARNSIAAALGSQEISLTFTGGGNILTTLYKLASAKGFLAPAASQLSTLLRARVPASARSEDPDASATERNLICLKTESARC